MMLARRMLIEAKAATGSPYGAIVERGILSGSWDNGNLIREQLDILRKERKKK